jgi:hypothetical protein
MNLRNLLKLSKLLKGDLLEGILFLLKEMGSKKLEASITKALQKKLTEKRRGLLVGELKELATLVQERRDSEAAKLVVELLKTIE